MNHRKEKKGQEIAAVAHESGSGRSAFAILPTNVPMMELDRTLILHQNVPNPFNPTTTISFSLVKGGHVQLAIYDVAGKLVRTLLDEFRESAVHKVAWNGTDARGREVASGVYFYKLITSDIQATKKMVLLK